MSRFVLTLRAGQDLDDIWEYIAADNIEAADRVLDRMEKALRFGHRVFFADTLPFETSSAPLPSLFPLYQDPHGGWHGAPYNAVWKLQAGRFLRAHATKVTRIAVALPPGSEVQRFEKLEPGVVEGWQ